MANQKVKKTINFVTSNAGKVKTMQNHIRKYGFEVVQKELSLVEPQADTAEAVALSKAMQAVKALKEPVVVEDSSFHIDALNGFPGPYIKYMLTTVGVKGILKLTQGIKNRTCRFTSAVAYVDSDGVPRTFVQKGDAGVLDTKVDHTQSSEAWSDLWRIFIPNGAKRPLTGLTTQERNKVYQKWEQESVFSKFAQWLEEKANPPKGGEKGRLLASEFEFPVPRARIAIRPRPHGKHKLLVIDSKKGKISHHLFGEIGNLLPKKTVIVVNTSKVVKASLRKVADDGTYLHVMYPSHPSLNNVYTLCPWKPPVGETIAVNGGKYKIEKAPIPGRDVRLGKLTPNDSNIRTLPEFLEKHGSIPIPIYVNSERMPDDRDKKDYQNCYAKAPGSIECPTAGLHFYPELMRSLKKLGFEFLEVTLHIGYGTWKSFKTKYVDEHDMDSEEMIISPQTLNRLREITKEGRPILGVGTSSVRVLESIAKDITQVAFPNKEIHKETNLFLYPPHKPKIANMLLTNFAYPRTPIMALPATFTKLSLLKIAYTEALEKDYLFYTFGDSILIL